jgi:hypothetical protein
MLPAKSSYYVFMKWLCPPTALLFFALPAFCQKPAFDVASVRQSATQSSTGLILVRPGQPDEPGRIRWTSVSMKALVMFAWHGSGRRPPVDRR